MKLLVCALTSSDEGRLNRLIQSVKNQTPVSGLEVHGVVVCNTLNEDYPAKARDIAIANQWDFHATESNGKPGKGKNSALHIFNYYYPGYDYLLLMDGDDFLYECAFEQLHRLLKQTNCDVIGLQTNDVLDYLLYENVTRVALEIEDRTLFLYSWFEKQYNIYALPDQVWRVDRVNNKLGRHSTPDRIVVYSHKAAKVLKCSEELPVYEDYVLSLHAQSEYKKGNLKYINTSSTFIYVYDKTGMTSTCKQYNEAVGGDWSAHEQLFIQETESLDEQLGDFHAAEVPFVFVPMPKVNPITYKIEQVRKYMDMLKV